MARKAPRVKTPKVSKSKDTKYMKGGESKAKAKAKGRDLAMPKGKVKNPFPNKSNVIIEKEKRNDKPETVSLRSEAMKLAGEYRKQGYSQGDALRKAWQDVKGKANKNESGRLELQQAITKSQILVNKLLDALDDAVKTAQEMGVEIKGNYSQLIDENREQIENVLRYDRTSENSEAARQRADIIVHNIHYSGYTIDDLCDLIEALVIAFYDIDEAEWMGMDLNDDGMFMKCLAILDKAING